MRSTLLLTVTSFLVLAFSGTVALVAQEPAAGREGLVREPRFLEIEPPDGALQTTGEVRLRGLVDGAEELTVDGLEVSLVDGSFVTEPFQVSEGDRVFLLVATDGAGRKVERLHRVVVDTRGPRLEISRPAGHVVTSSTIEVRGRAIDPHLNAVLVDGRSATLDGSTFHASVELEGGEPTVVVEARDAAGHASFHELHLRLDTEPPTVDVRLAGRSLVDGAAYSEAISPEIVADGADHLEVLLDGAPYEPGRSVDREGRHTLTVRARDAAGHTTVHEVRFEVDRQPPSFAPFRKSLTVGATRHTVRGRVSGATEVRVNGRLARLEGGSFSAGPFELSPGDNRFDVVATDGAGNKATAELVVKADTSAPTLTVTAPPEGAVLGSTPVTVTGTVTDDAVVTEVKIGANVGALAGDQFTISGVALTEGSNALTVEATDDSANTSQVVLDLTLDTTAPTIQVLADGAPIVDATVFPGLVTPVIQVTDATAVTVETTLDSLPFASNTSVTSTGSHLLSVTATDAAGNSAARNVTFTVEAAPPVFQSLSPADGTVQSAAQVTLAGHVTQPGQVTLGTELTIDGVAAALIGADFVAGPYDLTADAARTFTLIATSAGGQTAQQTLTVTRDVSAPALAISSPADGAVLDSATLSVTGTASDLHLDQVSVNDRSATLTGGTFQVDQVGLAEGENTLRARAVDSAGNVTELERTVVLDSEAPEVVITDPAPGTVVGEATYTLSGTVHDQHLDRVEVAGQTATLTGDPSLPPLAPLGGKWSISVALIDGENDLVVEAYDTLGHRGEATVRIAREMDAPDIHIDLPAEGFLTTTPTIDVSGTVDVELSETNEVMTTVTVNGEAATVDAGGTFSVTGVALVEGENRIVARALDSLSRQGIHTRDGVLDTVGPAFVDAAPEDGAFALPASSAFRVTFSEPLADPAPGAWILRTSGGTVLPATATATGEVLRLAPQAALPLATGLDLELTAALTDLAGNALTTPRTLTFTTGDGSGAPGAPVVSPVPPLYLCASSWTLQGTADPEGLVRVEGGASNAAGRAAADGTFSLVVPLLSDRLHRLSVTSTDLEDSVSPGSVSPATLVEIVQDCTPPTVASAERVADDFVVTFSEPVDGTTVTSALTLSAGGAEVAGSVAPAQGTATFSPSSTPPAGPLRLDVSEQVTDLAGNALAYPYSETFDEAAEESFLSGTVIDNATGRPLPGARVVVTATDGIALTEPLPEQTTTADGRFLIPVPAGTHDLTLARPGYTPVFRIATTSTGVGTEIFAPRLTPASVPVDVGTSGSSVTAGGATLDVPGGALAAAADVALTPVDEQGLAALLPYGWSPRGAVWLDADTDFQTPAALSFPVESADGTLLTVAELDLVTLQWRSLGDVAVTGGKVTVNVSTLGAYAALEADTGALAPPAAISGEVLGSSPTPTGTLVASAAVTFDPEMVLATQTSLATVIYTLSDEVASGLPLTVVIQEELTLLDDTVRREAPYRADLVLYRTSGGASRSRFRLQPSVTARTTPIQLGAEDVTVERYADESVRGNVLGPEGGTVLGDEGDRIDVPAGSLLEPTAIVITRRTVADLPLAAPAGGTVDGVLELDLGGTVLLSPGRVTLTMDTPPAAGEAGLLLQVVDVDGTPFYRAVAELEPSATGWTSKAIDSEDLPWPGVTEGGQYVFVHLTAPYAFVRGTALGADGLPLVGGIVSSPSVEWIQITDSQGRYVLPVPVGEIVIEVDHPTNGNTVSRTVTTNANDERVDLDPRLLAIGPEVISTTPADGETALAGVTPQVSFSEPVDPASVSAAITLEGASGIVEIDVDVQGALVTVLPRATLAAGAYQLRLATGLRDLQGYALVSPVTVGFTVEELALPSEVDATRIRLFEPDATGLARVVGEPAAVPSGHLTWLENLDSYASTTSVTAAQDGSFEISIAASVSDRLLLHILIPGANEVIVPLGHYWGEDLQSAWIGPEGGELTTVDGYTVLVEAGTFVDFARVRVAPQATEPPAAPRPVELEAFTVFELDFGGAEAKKPVQLRIPAAPGTEEIVYLLSRRVETYRGPAWMVFDLMWLDGDALTTEDADLVDQTGNAALTGAPEPAALASGGALETKDALNTPPRWPPASYKRYLPEAVYPGTYEVQRPIQDLVFMVNPMGPTWSAIIWNRVMEGMVATLNRAIATFLEFDAVLMPSVLGKEYKIDIEDPATGAPIVSGTFSAPIKPGDLEVLPPDSYGDFKPPLPAGGSPLRFYRLFPNTILGAELDAGVEWSYNTQTETLGLDGDAGAADPEAEIVLLDYDADKTWSTQAGIDGSFAIQGAGPMGHNWVVAIGAVLSPDEAPEITFTEGLAEGFDGLKVVSELGNEIKLLTRAIGDTRTVRLEPLVRFRAGDTYTLKIGPEVTDPLGNAWGRTLEIRFDIARGDVLGTYDVHAFKPAFVGPYAFVPSTVGLKIVDFSDPTDPVSVLPADYGFPLAGPDPVWAITFDVHGLGYVTSGGLARKGELNILDLQKLDFDQVDTTPSFDWFQEAIRATTQLTDQDGGTGTQLPQGQPKKVSVLSHNKEDRWRAGQQAPDPELVITPFPAPSTVTVGGRAPEGQEVVLENLDSGSRQSVVADEDGEFQFTETAYTGDRLKLTRPGRLITRWLAGQPLAGDLWVAPYLKPESFEMTVSGQAKPLNPVTLWNLADGSWTRVDADESGHFSVTHSFLPRDPVVIYRNEFTFPFVRTPGAGIQVADGSWMYRNTHPHILSYLIGTYSGFGDPNLVLCDTAVSDFSTALLDVDTLLDMGNEYPYTVAALMGFKGFALIDSNINNPGEMSFINQGCAEIDGNANITSFEVIQKYPFDHNANGEFEDTEYWDLVVVGHRTEGLLIYAITNRAFVIPVGQIELPDDPADIQLDRENRRLIVSAYEAGVLVVDFDIPPFFQLLDDDLDGIDDRVVETIQLGGNSNIDPVVLSELGLAFVTGQDHGVTSVVVGEPKLVAVRPAIDSGPRREIRQLAPYGVPSAPEDPSDPESLELPGSFHILAYLPGLVPDEVKVDVIALGPGKLEIDPPGDPARVGDLPPTSLRGIDAVVLRRKSTHPLDAGYHIFEAEERIDVVADPRAARDFENSDRDDEQCPRCDQPEYLNDKAREIFSGDTVTLRFAQETLDLLEPIYGRKRLDDAAFELAGVRWDIAPSTRQEPTLNPSKGSGDVVPGTLLHSGEMSLSAVDLFVRGRGLDFTFQRSYRNQTIGGGPLGPGWDHAYHQRLRQRPDGDVEWYDGTGRRELFELRDDGSLEPPEGRFVDLVEVSTGWVMVDSRRNTVRFDAHGRLASITDPFKTSPETGSEMVFHYDRHSRLSTIVDSLDRLMSFEYDEFGRLIKLADFDQREVEFVYDADWRLVEVHSPKITSGMEGAFTGARLISRYGYDGDLTGGLAQKLAHRDNLTSVTDPRGTTWLDLTYTDVDTDGRRDEVTRQEWGGFPLTITYLFDLHQTRVTDRRSILWRYEHDEDGHMTKSIDPVGATSTIEYGEGGRIEEVTRPLGRQSVFEYLEGDVPRRSKGMVVRHRLIPDLRGTNSTGPESCSVNEEEECRTGVRCVCAFAVTSDTGYDFADNLASRVSDRRGNESDFQRGSRGLAEMVSLPTGGEVQFEYNDFGQPTREVSPIGTEKTYTYYQDGPSRGYLKSETVAGILTTSYEYDARGNITAVTDRRGARTETKWNEVDWMTETTRAATGSNDGAPALGYVNRFYYDGAGNVKEQHSPLGDTGAVHSVARATFGVLNEVLSTSREIEVGGPTITTSHTYDPNFNLVQTTDPNGNVDTFNYEERNLKSFASLSNALTTEQYFYDLEQNLTGRIDGRGHSWQYTYDGKGRLMELKDPLGNRSLTQYDDSDNPTVIENLDAGGELLARRVNVYDGLSRVVEVRDSLFDAQGGETLAVTRSEYDMASNLRKMTDPEGRETFFEYDNAERLVRIIDPEGNVTENTLDGNGNVTRTTLTEMLPDASTETVDTHTAYDAINRPVSVRDALDNTSQTVYDARSNVARLIDQENHLTISTYDALDRLKTVTQPEGIALNYTYDNNSNLKMMTDALGNGTKYTYDALDRPTIIEYADTTQWSTEYDPNHNVTRIIDANGTVIDQTHDIADRLTSRSATPAPGVEGITLETYVYDGLDRQIQSQSGDVVVTTEFDSLSRLTAETVMGRRVEYSYNLASGSTGAVYPSGLTVDVDLDALDRPMAIRADTREAVGYQYRGPGLLHSTTLGNGLVGALSYDAARRLTEHMCVNQGGDMVVGEILAWSPRWLKVSHARHDVAEASRVMSHDGASRVTEVGNADLGVENNTTPTAGQVGNVANGFSYRYDVAQNLLSRTTRSQGAEEQVDLPPDASGRNRPASVGATDLQWDANGNLVRKGDLILHYDFHNRLVRVEREGVGDLARYEYDAQNRRVKKIAGGVEIQFAWAGWRAIEEYQDGQLKARRVFGTGMDEIVRFEIDLDGNGSLENELVPVFDQTGNLVAMTDTAGIPVERYDYSPYGEQLILVDATAPTVDQVRLVGGELWIEMSEDVVPDILTSGRDSGLVTLTDDATQQSLVVSVAQPVLTGRMARRRLVMSATDPPAVGDAVTLRFEATTLRDPFHNPLAAPFELSFTWPATDTVLHDASAPTWQQVTIEDDHLLVTFSEEVDAASVASAVTVDGVSLSWTVEPDRYAFKSVEPLALGGHDLNIDTSVVDLDGQALLSDLNAAFAIASAGSSFLVDQVSDPRRIASTATGNLHGFHGRPLDPETGFLYFRNRYYDPDLGRFVSVDPMGFVDGPSPYAFAGYGPFNNSDPLGLCIDGLFDKTEFCQKIRKGLDEATDKFINENFGDDHSTRISLQFMKGQLKAIQRIPKNLVTGALSILKMAGGAAKAAAWAVTHPEEAMEEIGEAVANFDFDEVKSNAEDAVSQYLNNFVNASPEKQGEVFGEVVLEEVITGGMSKVSKVGKASKVRPKRNKPCDCGCKSLNCFAAGTLVETEDGPKPIEEIEAGDSVWAYDEETGERRLAEVVRVFARTTLEVWRLEAGTEVIETTGEHPFYVAAKGWVEANELQRGDLLVTLGGTEVLLGRVERQDRTIQVFNFEVFDLHNYYISAESILAHNCQRTKLGGKITEPILPPRTIVEENGVEIRHYTRSGDHGPPHAHVIGGGIETKIGQNGKPIDGSPELTSTQKTVVDSNIKRIKKVIRKIGRWHWFESQ